MSVMEYEELMKILTHFITNRRGWKVSGWNVGPGEKNILRYTDINDDTHAAYVIHIYTEMREDETFGVFDQIVKAVLELSHKTNSELLIVFRRPNSKIVFIYKMSAKMMNETYDLWTSGKQGQFQIPIGLFEKLDEYEV